MTVTGTAPLEVDDLGDRNLIGKGGMAKVYALPSYRLPESPAAAVVYKAYRPSARPVPLFGLDALVRHRAGLAPEHRKALDGACNWPLRTVVDGGDGASGVILPLIPDDYFVTLRLSSGATERKPTEAQFLFMDGSYCRRVGIGFPDEDQRLQICRSLAYAIGVLHRIGVVYGDLSARNILYRVSPRPGVLLVDCDAVRVHGGAAASGLQPHSPDWEPPEAIAARRHRDSTGYNIQNLATDRYKLGLAFLRILTPGVVSSNTDPAAARSALPMHLYTMLQRSLGVDATGRPSAKDWYKAFIR